MTATDLMTICPFCGRLSFARRNATLQECTWCGGRAEHDGCACRLVRPPANALGGKRRDDQSR